MSVSPSATSRPTAPLVPLDADERLHALDILRGLALFGMILVHFHQKMRLEATGLEDLISWGVWVLVEQKSWGTFAFLFGMGFAVLLRRLEARQARVLPIYLRRLATLASIMASLFGAELLEPIGVPGIWFPFGIGVSRSQYVYAIAIPLFAILIARTK